MQGSGWGKQTWEVVANPRNMTVTTPLAGACHEGFGFGVRGLGFGIWSLEFGVWCLVVSVRVDTVGRVLGFGFSGFGFRVSGSGFSRFGG